MQYYIETEEFDIFKNTDKWKYINDSDNITAHGISDLKCKIKELQNRNIKILEITKYIKSDGTFQDVTNKYYKIKVVNLWKL